MILSPCLTLLLAALLAEALSDEQADITWIKPAAGSTFGPGDQIVGEWTAAKTPASLSVSLCSSISGSCGGTVSPQITQYGDSYTISVAVPDISSTSGYYLKMTDEQGNEMQSPGFSLDPSAKSGQSAATAAASPSSTNAVSSSSTGANSDSNSDPSSESETSGAGSSDGNTQAPLSAKGTSASDSGNADGASSGSETNAKGSSTSAPKASSGDADNSANASASGSDSGSLNNSKPRGSANGQASATNAPTSTSSSTNDDDDDDNASDASPSPSSDPEDPASTSGVDSQNRNIRGAGTGSDKTDGAPTTLSTQTGVSKAAIAVPLSFVGAALVAALGLCIAKKRKRTNDDLRSQQQTPMFPIPGPGSGYPSRQNSFRPLSRAEGGPSRSRSGSGSGSGSGYHMAGDIEKAIDALEDVAAVQRSRSRANSYSGRGNSMEEDAHAEMMYVPVRGAAYPVPREDVRRDRLPGILMRAGSYFGRRYYGSARYEDRERERERDREQGIELDGGNRRRSLRFSMRRESAQRRQHPHRDGDREEGGWDHRDRDQNHHEYEYYWSPRRDDADRYTTLPTKPTYRRTPFPSLSHVSRRSTAASLNPNAHADADVDTEDDAGSATDAVLSDYVERSPGHGHGRSTSSRSSRIPIRARARDSIPGSWKSMPNLDFDFARPREPERSHSRHLAPDMNRSRSHGGYYGYGGPSASHGARRGSGYMYGGTPRYYSKYVDEDADEETGFFSPAARTSRTF